MVGGHIQDHDAAESVRPHWGYADRVVPCTNDAGSCEYLDVVYEAHDIGMIYMGIIWLTIGGVVLVWALARHLGRPSSPALPGTGSAPGGLAKVRRTLASHIRRYLLPDVRFRAIFGRTTRLQVLILAALVAYLTIWTFVGIIYNIWVTPVTDMPGVYNTRTSLGPWSDRIGVIAYALTPLSVLLSSRESILSLLTGVPYQNFNFLHRWLGYIIFVQSSLHTIGWCIVEIRLYQPQPAVAETWIRQLYMIWGVVAMILLTILFVLSTPWAIRRTGYEFFRKSHYVLAMVYIGACWAHWQQLQCFLLPSLLIWGLDRGARFVRTALLHYQHQPSGTMGFSSSKAAIVRFSDPDNEDVLRLELDQDQQPWKVGQHFYLCFKDCSIWQSHPFTPLNAPVVENGKVKHSYLLRAKQGETRKLAEKVAGAEDPSTAVILTGPYGESLADKVTPNSNVLCVAGGTGITYVLPLLLHLSRQPPSPNRKVELIWAVRHARDTQWVRREVDELLASKTLNLTVQFFVTRDTDSKAPSVSDVDEKTKTGDILAVESSSESIPLGPEPEKTQVRKTGGAATDKDRHPDLASIVETFVSETIQGPTTVFASGPGGVISDLRAIVARCNSGSKVWNGQERYDVDLVCDDRLEW